MKQLIEPLGSKVVVKVSEAAGVSAGGIILPDSVQKKATEGTVYAVGPGAPLDDGTIRPMTVKEGDVVLFGKYGGTEITVGGQDFMIMDEDQIYARLPQPEVAEVGEAFPA